jgi:hypothetical protein
MKMHDVGKKRSEDMGMMSSPSKDWKNEVVYPSFTLDCKKVPELYDATVGDMVTLTIKGVVTRTEKSSSKSNDRHEIGIDIHTVGADRKSVDDDEEGEKGDSAAEEYREGKVAKKMARKSMMK